MSKAKLEFSGIVVELQGAESTHDLAQEALELLGILVREGLKLENAEGDTGGTPTEQKIEVKPMPSEVMKAYL